MAVISHAYWQRRFAGDANIVGREVTINNTLIRAHCTSPTRLEGCDQPYRAPYLIRDYHLPAFIDVNMAHNLFPWLIQ